MKVSRIVLDTNLWISFLISKRYKDLGELLRLGTVRLFFSSELFEEFIEVVHRPKFEKIFSVEDINKLIDLFDVYGEWIKVSSNVQICRDPKDDFLLNLCIDGNIDYLITGDKDLLVIREIKSTHILTYTEFIEQIR